MDIRRKESFQIWQKKGVKSIILFIKCHNFQMLDMYISTKTHGNCPKNMIIKAKLKNLIYSKI